MGGELVDRLGVGVDDGANVNAPNSMTHSSATAGGHVWRVSRGRGLPESRCGLSRRTRR